MILCQANIVRRDPREEKSIRIERVETSDLKSGSRTRTFLEHSTIMKTLLKVVGVLGVSLIMAGTQLSYRKQLRQLPTDHR